MLRYRRSGLARIAGSRPFREAWAGCLLAIVALAGAAEVTAQAGTPYVYITQPEEWRDGRSVIVQAGRSITIKGLASHPSGVMRVLVNGEEAVIQQDPQLPDLISFEKVLMATDTPRQVVIRIVPRESEPFERRYSVEPPGRAAGAQARDTMARPPAGAARPPAPQPTGGSEQLPNPWRGFRKRGIAYGLAAVGGGALTLLKTSDTAEICEQGPAGSDCFLRTEEEPAYVVPGLALVGGAVLGVVIDGLVTSRKAARASRSTGGDGGDDGVRLEPPALAQRGDRLFLEFVRIRF